MLGLVYHIHQTRTRNLIPTARQIVGHEDRDLLVRVLLYDNLIHKHINDVPHIILILQTSVRKTG